MGACLAIYAVDSSIQQRVREIVAAGDHAAAEELAEHALEAVPRWGAERGDHKTWDVVHWVLTGRESGHDSGTMRLFGIPPYVSHELGEWSAMINAPTTKRFAAALQKVDPATHRARLERVPDTVYFAVKHPGVLADARDLVEFAARAADEDRGLLLVVA